MTNNYWRKRTNTFSKLALIFVGVSLLIQPETTKGQYSEPDEPSLKGLKAFDVLIEALTPEARQGGLNEIMIKTDVELRLRKVGVQVFPESYFYSPRIRMGTIEAITGLKGEKARAKWNETMPPITKEDAEMDKLYDARGTLYINVNILRIQGEVLNPHFIYSISVEVKQTARLERDTSIICYGVVTWDKGSIGIIPADEMQRKIRDTIADQVDMFLNAYLTQNPKKD